MLRSLVGLSVALALAGGGVASAADVQFDPYVEAGAIWNDNYTLENTPAEVLDVAGGFVNVGAQLRAVQPRTTWVFEPRIRSYAFPDESQLDSTDYFVNLSGERRNTRSSFGGALEYWNQDIVQNQLPGATIPDPDLGQSPNPDSGRILGENRQKLLRARPYAQFQLTERLNLNVEGRYEDVNFDRDILNLQVSYQTVGGALQLDRRFTPASRFGLRVDLQSTEPDAGVGKADLVGLQGTWDYQVAERVTAYARAGAKRSKLEVQGATPLLRRNVTETTPLVAAGVRWSFLKSELFLDAKREVDANSSGFVVERNDVRLLYNHRFTVRFRGYLAAYIVDDESVTATGLYAPRRYYAGSAGLEWRVRQSLSLLAQIDRSNQKFEGERDSADGNSARISVLYRPRRQE